MEWTGGIHGQIRVLALQEGREEGLLAARNMLTTIFLNRFGEVPKQILERIEKATSQALQDWTRRALVANSPMEVLD